MIWFSILGVLPFTLALPYANLFWTNVLTVAHRPHPVLGLLGDRRASRQELVPGRVGLIAGIFFGLPSASAASARPRSACVADHKGIDYVFWICSFLPLLGLLTIFLPDMRPQQKPVVSAQPRAATAVANSARLAAPFR